jgi:hypothetical protein
MVIVAASHATLAYPAEPSYLLIAAVGGSKPAMSKPVTVSIPHKLGKAEARRRLEGGLGAIRTHFASVLSVEEEVWSGDSLAFRARVLAQLTTGTITVAEDHVQVEVMLPWALALVAQKATDLIRTRGRLMLDKK